MAVKILESITDNLEEIEEEFMVLSDLSKHPNLPEFHGIFLKKGKTAEEDQLWFVMELMHGGSITDLGNKFCVHFQKWKIIICLSFLRQF